MYRIPWVPQLSSLSSQTVSFEVSSDVVIPDVPSLDAVSYLIPYMCGIVSRRHSLFLQGPVLYGYPSVVVSVCRHRLSHCGLDWDCMLLEWNGVYTWLIVCVTVTLRAHVLVIIRVVGDSVSELSRLPHLSVSAQHSKVHNPISPLFRVAIFKACFS